MWARRAEILGTVRLSMPRASATSKGNGNRKKTVESTRYRLPRGDTSIIVDLVIV
jgi:hypothetical protein